jgi:hypothetical protein
MKMQHRPTVVFFLVALLLVTLVIALQRTDARRRHPQSQPPEQARQIYRAARHLLERVAARAASMTPGEADKWQPLLDECLQDVRRLEAEYPSLEAEDRP